MNIYLSNSNFDFDTVLNDNREYKEILKALRWPFIRDSINAQTNYNPSTAQVTEFKIVTEHLFHLQLPYPFIFYNNLHH